jgi:hypothetical protein
MPRQFPPLLPFSCPLSIAFLRLATRCEFFFIIFRLITASDSAHLASWLHWASPRPRSTIEDLEYASVEPFTACRTIVRRICGAIYLQPAAVVPASFSAAVFAEAVFFRSSLQVPGPQDQVACVDSYVRAHGARVTTSNDVHLSSVYVSPPVCFFRDVPRRIVVRVRAFHRLQMCRQKKNWCVPFGTQRVEAEGMSKNEQRH